MPSQRYEFSTEARRYRDTETGRFLGKAKVLELRDGFLDTQKSNVRSLAGKLSAGDLDLKGWEKAVRAEIKKTFLAEALLGCGGQNAMTARGYGTVGSQVKAQYKFLREFAREIAEDGMSEARIGARSELYIAAARQAYEKARAGAFGLKLPAYPGDGQTECVTRCRCHWDISETDDEFQAFWRLGGSEHCDTCEENAGKWNPLTVAKKNE